MYCSYFDRTLDIHPLSEMLEYVVHVVLAVAPLQLALLEGLDVAVDEGEVPLEPVGLALAVVVVVISIKRDTNVIRNTAKGWINL